MLEMIPGRKYHIKTLLAYTIPYNTTLRFTQYYTRKEWDHATQRSIPIRFADFTVPASDCGPAFDWSVRVEHLREWVAIAGSCPQQRDAQLGLLGTLPTGQSLPYDLGRLIASYV